MVRMTIVRALTVEYEELHGLLDRLVDEQGMTATWEGDLDEK